MLRYFARGRVRWKTGMRCNTRTNWEFYAVIDGRCGLRFTDRQRPLLRERTLWVFAPECSHAWASPRGADYERISMHFASVPYPLDDVVRAHGGWLERPIGDAEIAQLRVIAAELEPAFCRPTAVSPLVCQRHLLDLSLLLLADHAFAELPPALTDLAHFKIERALSWYAEHLARNPTVKEVADAMHVPPAISAASSRKPVARAPSPPFAASAWKKPRS